MIDDICIIGAGRVGSALAARLAERGVRVTATGRSLDVGRARLVLVCTPDSAIAEVARGVPPGPWVAHTSGATTLDALAPHTRRFSLHPLQTFTRGGDPEQLDGAFAAVSGETAEALDIAFELARTLGLEPFELPDAERPLYHAGASVASNFLVTLYRAAADLVTAAGAPERALVPLMRRTIENGFELTGPIQRGDVATVDAHLAAIRARRPQLERLYRELAAATTAIPSR